MFVSCVILGVLFFSFLGPHGFSLFPLFLLSSFISIFNSNYT